MVVQPTGYPQYPNTYIQQPGQVYIQQPAAYGGYVPPPQPVAPPQPNIVQPPAYSGPSAPAQMYEPPPPYTETPQQAVPSAPPAGK